MVRVVKNFDLISSYILCENSYELTLRSITICNYAIVSPIKIFSTMSEVPVLPLKRLSI